MNTKSLKNKCLESLGFRFLTQGCLGQGKKNRAPITTLLTLLVQSKPTLCLVGRVQNQLTTAQTYSIHFNV